MSTYNHDELLEQVFNLLEDISGEDDVREHPNDDLFEYGYLDSMGAVELLLDIEDNYGVQIAPTEVPREEMNTAERITHQLEIRLN